MSCKASTSASTSDVVSRSLLNAALRAVARASCALAVSRRSTPRRAARCPRRRAVGGSCGSSGRSRRSKRVAGRRAARSLDRARTRPPARCTSVEMLVVEERSQPLVESGDEGVLLDVDAPRMVGVGSWVVGRELAAVVVAAVVPLTLHSSAADAAGQEARQDVMAALSRRACGRSSLGELGSGGVEQLT